jgi:hypothetical protein
MEKNTFSGKSINEKKRRIALTIGRFTAMSLLILTIIFISLPGSAPAEAQSQLSYRNASFSAGSSPSAAKIGDLDGDGRNDIAVVNRQGSLQLFFNTGAGSFERASLNGLWPSDSTTLDVDIGDLNGDGRKDIAVAFSTPGGAVSVLLNQGNRTFSAPVSYDSCQASRGVAIGDLDQDGDNDLADINQCSRSGVLLNNGHGNFIFNGVYGSGTSSRSIVLADFNRDGSKDIAYVNRAVGGNVTVMFNNGDGSFSPPSFHYAGDVPDDLTTGDFDGEGTTDIAIANSYYSQIIILFNSADGSFPGYSEITGTDTPTSITSGDFNGDGRLDFAVASQGNNRISVFLKQGGYDFSDPINFSVGQTPVDIVAGRLDGDSLPDLVTVNQSSGNITVLFSGGSVSQPPPPPPPPPAQITLTASKRSTSSAKLVDLRWSGASGARVDIYRNGSRITTATNNGSYTDRMASRTRGTFKYKVCVAGSQQCSGEASVSF